MRLPRVGRLLAAATIVTLAATGFVAAPAAPASAGTVVNGPGTQYYFADSWSDLAFTGMTFGKPGDLVYIGDWDADGYDTIVVRRGNAYHFTTYLISGKAMPVVHYGRATDVVLMGDWDGDGMDTPAVRRGNAYYIKNDLTGGAADIVVRYGKATDTVLVGDWNGDGVDTLAIRRGITYHFRDDLASAPASRVLSFGRAADTVFTGDWNGDGVDTLTVRRGNLFYISNDWSGKSARTLAFGKAEHTIITGDWDGDGTQTFGIRYAPDGRPSGLTPYMPLGKPGRDVDCTAFNNPAAAQWEYDRWYPGYGDVHDLDDDGDHVACEDYFA